MGFRNMLRLQVVGLSLLLAGTSILWRPAGAAGAQGVTATGPATTGPESQTVDRVLQWLAGADSAAKIQAAEEIRKSPSKVRVRALLAEAIKVEDLEVRVRLLRVIEAIDAGEYAEDLAQALAQWGNADVRDAVRKSLLAKPNPGVIAALVTITEGAGKNRSLSRDLARTISQVRGDAAVPGLLVGLDSHDLTAFVGCAASLGAIGNEQAVRGLLSRVAKADKERKPILLEAISRVENPLSLSVLAEARASAVDVELRKVLDQAIAQCRVKEASRTSTAQDSKDTNPPSGPGGSALDPADRARALAVVSDRNLSWENRKAAVASLIRDGAEEGIVSILTAVRGSEDAPFLEGVSGALADLKNPKAVPLLVQAACDGTDSRLGGACSLAVARMPGEGPAKALLKAYTEGVSDTGNREIIARGIAAVRAPEAVGVLSAVAKDWTDDRLARAAVAGIGSVGTPEAATTLFQLAESNVMSGKPERLSAAEDALAIAVSQGQDNVKVVQSVIAYLKSPHAPIRLTAAKALGAAKKNEAALKALRDAAQGEADPAVLSAIQASITRLNKKEG